MGRYAQARRRGGVGGAGGGLLPPPAPVLVNIAGHVSQRATGLDDTGGRMQLQQREGGTEEWAEAGDEPWAHEFDWGVVGLFEDNELRAREVGNGVDYLGNSEWSDILGPL